MYDMCPNSVFKDDEDITTSHYYTPDEFNDLDIQKSEEGILLIHINAVSLYSNYDKIVSLIDQLKMFPSLIFISETRVLDSNYEFLLPRIGIQGYNLVTHNSPTNAGGSAIYISDTLQYVERNDIKFDYPNCEACFIEVVCDNTDLNPIFGALYRHPGIYARPFNNHLGEFLEKFTERGVNLTMLGDINIDLNKSNVVSHEYVNIINSAGFTTLINQPTQIFHYESLSYVSCSTLDHIITNCSSHFSKVGILVADVSDHLPVFGSMSLSKPRINKVKDLYRRNFHESKKDMFVQCLTEKLKNVNFDIDPNPMTEKIIFIMQEAISATFPLKKVSNKQAKKILNPWMSKEILKVQKERDLLKKKWIGLGHVENSPEHIKFKK